MLLRALIVFVAVTTSDVCWVRCVSHASGGRRWSAACWSVALYALTALSVVAYVGDHRMIAPALLGAFVGTALGVRK
jgi:hypothetical protein